MSVYEVPLISLGGERLDPGLLRGRTALIVNVASNCGLTPQYEGLQALYDRYRERGLVVVGVPCDQFAAQEPRTPQEIAAFCSTSYSVTFPLTEKADVNGHNRHPLYELLTAVPDRDGVAGEVQWNFEKFVVSPRGEPIARFRPTTQPDARKTSSITCAHLPTHGHPTSPTRGGSPGGPNRSNVRPR